MAERSRCSTRALKADQAFCKQVARLLFTDAEPIQRAFLGELVREVLALTEWAMEHEDDPSFEAGKALEAWARRRSRGAYRPQEQSTDNIPQRPNTTTPQPPDTIAPARRDDSLRGAVPVMVAIAGTAKMED